MNAVVSVFLLLCSENIRHTLAHFSKDLYQKMCAKVSDISHDVMQLTKDRSGGETWIAQWQALLRLR